MLAVLGCAPSPALPPQLPAAAELSSIKARPDVVELLRALTAPNDETMHGPFHRAKDDLQEKLWAAVRALTVVDQGDHLLFHAIDRVYTRYDPNYYHGHDFHWPYLCSARAIQLCDKLLADYPASTLTERTLILKAYALRLPATEPNGDSEADRTTYRLQRQWAPRYDAARDVYREVLARFPAGRHAKLAKVFAEQKELSITLPSGPKEPDPKNPIPLD